MTTSHVYPLATAAEKRKNLPMKPTVGGKPARENMRRVMIPARTGCR